MSADARGFQAVPEPCDEHAAQAVESEGPEGSWRVLLVLVQLAWIHRAQARDSIRQQCTPEGAEEADSELLWPLLMSLGCLGCYLGEPEATEGIEEAVAELHRDRAGLGPLAVWRRGALPEEPTP